MRLFHRNLSIVSKSISNDEPPKVNLIDSTCSFKTGEIVLLNGENIEILLNALANYNSNTVLIFGHSWLKPTLCDYNLYNLIDPNKGFIKTSTIRQSLYFTAKFNILKHRPILKHTLTRFNQIFLTKELESEISELVYFVINLFHLNYIANKTLSRLSEAQMIIFNIANQVVSGDKILFINLTNPCLGEIEIYIVLKALNNCLRHDKIFIIAVNEISSQSIEFADRIFVTFNKGIFFTGSRKQFNEFIYNFELGSLARSKGLAFIYNLFSNTRLIETDYKGCYELMMDFMKRKMPLLEILSTNLSYQYILHENLLNVRSNGRFEKNELELKDVFEIFKRISNSTLITRRIYFILCFCVWLFSFAYTKALKYEFRNNDTENFFGYSDEIALRGTLTFLLPLILNSISTIHMLLITEINVQNARSEVRMGLYSRYSFLIACYLHGFASILLLIWPAVLYILWKFPSNYLFHFPISILIYAIFLPFINYINMCLARKGYFLKVYIFISTILTIIPVPYLALINVISLNLKNSKIWKVLKVITLLKNFQPAVHLNAVYVLLICSPGNQNRAIMNIRYITMNYLSTNLTIPIIPLACLIYNIFFYLILWGVLDRKGGIL